MTDILDLDGWNPLKNDGDALRLAVGLGMTIRNFGHKVSVVADEQFDEYVVNGDPYAATRRAIVRAAAEIGKGMVDLHKSTGL